MLATVEGGGVGVTGRERGLVDAAFAEEVEHPLAAGSDGHQAAEDDFALGLANTGFALELR